MIRLNDHPRIRDAAEELRNATISAANALIFSHLGAVPASH